MEGVGCVECIAIALLAFPRVVMGTLHRNRVRRLNHHASERAWFKRILREPLQCYRPILRLFFHPAKMSSQTAPYGRHV